MNRITIEKLQAWLTKALESGMVGDEEIVFVKHDSSNEIEFIESYQDTFMRDGEVETVYIIELRLP